jgi:hypothetical protein
MEQQHQMEQDNLLDTTKVLSQQASAIAHEHAPEQATSEQMESEVLQHRLTGQMEEALRSKRTFRQTRLLLLVYISLELIPFVDSLLGWPLQLTVERALHIDWPHRLQVMLHTLFLRGHPYSDIVPTVGCVLSTFLVSRMFRAKQRYKTAMQSLMKSEDLRVVGPLTEALSTSDTRSIAASALCRLLPRLQFGDAHLLNEKQRRSLYRELEGTDTDLILAILKAFEQVGDSKDLPYVERLAQAAAERPTGGRLLAEAQHCLLFLKARAEHEHTRQTLLRAASASDTPPDVLLRPASSTPETEPQQLLRAGTAEENNAL